MHYSQYELSFAILQNLAHPLCFEIIENIKVDIFFFAIVISPKGRSLRIFRRCIISPASREECSCWVGVVPVSVVAVDVVAFLICERYCCCCLHILCRIGIVAFVTGSFCIVFVLSGR